MFELFKLWWKNLFKHIDDGYTNTEGESHKYTSLMDESVKLGEESYAFIDKNPPHLVLETPLENNKTLENPRDNEKTTLETLEDFINSHPNFDEEKTPPQVPKRLPKSMKQRFQQAQYQAFHTDIPTDTPSKNTRSKKRRKLNPRFRDCLTQDTTKTTKNNKKLAKTSKNATTTPNFETLYNSKKGGEANPQ
jgi:hypothetical protein